MVEKLSLERQVDLQSRDDVFELWFLICWE